MLLLVPIHPAYLSPPLVRPVAILLQSNSIQLPAGTGADAQSWRTVDIGAWQTVVSPARGGATGVWTITLSCRPALGGLGSSGPVWARVLWSSGDSQGGDVVVLVPGGGTTIVRVHGAGITVQGAPARNGGASLLTAAVVPGWFSGRAGAVPDLPQAQDLEQFGTAGIPPTGTSQTLTLPPWARWVSVDVGAILGSGGGAPNISAIRVVRNDPRLGTAYSDPVYALGIPMTIQPLCLDGIVSVRVEVDSVVGVPSLDCPVQWWLNL